MWKSFGIDPDNPDNPPALSPEDREAAKHPNRLMYFLSKDEQFTRILGKDELAQLFEVDPMAYHTKHIDMIFRRVFGKA